VEALRAFILERWRAFENAPARHPWPWETARWHELVFCLLFRLAEPHVQPGMARTLTAMMASLDMLRVECLAGRIGESGEVDLAHPDLALMLQLLQRAGLDGSKATAVVVTLCQTALGLEKRYRGKVQGYLRCYGQQMLAAVSRDFAYTQIDDNDARHAFTHWLQNTLNLPLAVSEPCVESFCRARGVSVEQLMAVADALDVNVALLDDMIADYIAAGHEGASDQEPGR
jgi:hypothetical protein